MHPFFKKIEHLTDKIIPYLLALLAVVLIIEFFFEGAAENYHTHIVVADYIIIFFFALDLIYKFNRVRHVKPFVKKYWLDILAVFPFFLIFRLIEEVFLLFRISQEVSEGQKFLHIGVEAEKIAKEEAALRELAGLQKESQFIKEIEAGTKLSRTRLFARFFRLPRLVKLFPFYEKPIKKEIKIIKKDVKKEALKLEKDVQKIEDKIRKKN